MANFLVWNKKEFLALTPLMKAATVFAWLTALTLILLLVGLVSEFPSVGLMRLVALLITFVGLTNLFSLVSV